MPKISESNLVRMKRFVREFGEILTIQTDEKTNSQVLYCQCCYCVVNSDQKSHVEQHLKTKSHTIKAKEFKTKQLSVQHLFKDCQKEFTQDLCEFMIALNIPFSRLSKPSAKKFAEKYIKYKIPDPSTLWKYNLTPLYVKTIEMIRNKLKDQNIWVQIDETEDSMKRKVANVIIGSLNTDLNECQKFVFDMNFLEKTNSSNIVQTVNKALNLLWPDGIRSEQILLLITDAAPYMKSAGNTLCDTYPKLTHITCMAHALHNVCEYLIVQYKDVNRLITCGKKVFKKAPNRINLFKEMHSEIPLPPEPLHTRWGLWLHAIKYYYLYFEQFSDVVQKLDPEESAFIEEVQELINSSNIKNEIAFIYCNFYCICDAITKLETSGLSLSDSLEIIDSVYRKLESIGDSGEKVFTKLKYVLNKNKGLERIRKIYQILNGNCDHNLDIDLSPQQIASFKWCPITDCDIERSFSKYKFILSDRRLRFEEKNLKMYLIIHCNTE